MGAERVLDEHREAIVAACERFSVARLRLFGSALRADWDPVTSDFDFLVEFRRRPGLAAFDQVLGFKLELEALLARNVDLVDWDSARNPIFRQNAESAAKTVYAA
jgi:predicted nucleotidyltransferase